MTNWYTSPEHHAANPPESWRIERLQDGSRVRWNLYVAAEAERPEAQFATKRDAEAARAGGFYFDEWEKDRRWYAGEEVPGRRTWAEVCAERERTAEQERRRAEKIGTTTDKLTQWQKAVDTRAPRAGELQDVATEMLDLLDNEELIDPTRLTRDEAHDLYRELAETWGFTSPVEHELHRVKYLGLGADRTAQRVLEDLYDAELEDRQHPFAA